MHSQISSRRNKLEFEFRPGESRLETWKLFEDILTGGAGLRLRVTGRSMAPFLEGGETLTVRRVSAERLRIGDIILFRDENGFLVLHRLVRRKRERDGGLLLQTKGDGLITLDHPIPGHQVLGVVHSIERVSQRGAKALDMESLLRRGINHCIALIGLLKARLSRSVLARQGLR